MRYREHEVEVISNNLANVSTDGFKRDRVALRSFGDMLITRMNDYGNEPKPIPFNPPKIGVMNLGGFATETEFVDFQQGRPKLTGNPLDLYLNGPGFFVVRTENGDRYTRNGALSLSETGELITQEGYNVLGTDNSPIRLNSTSQIQVNQDGEIRQDGAPTGRIQIVEFQDLSSIEKQGYTLFMQMDPTQNSATPSPSTSIEQGSIEASNVDPIMSLVRLISSQRAYEAAARAVDMFNDSMSRVSGELGRLPA
jgi:flagellar basal-body rod protein FlgG